MVPGVLLEPYMSQGDQGVAETPIVSKGLNCIPLCSECKMLPNLRQRKLMMFDSTIIWNKTDA